jgi:putative addiction module component (TIGR02574 family)
MTILSPEIAKLTVAERIQLVADLWDSIAAEAGQALTLTEAQIAELRRRAQAHRDSPESAISCEQRRAELSGRLAR